MTMTDPPALSARDRAHNSLTAGLAEVEEELRQLRADKETLFAKIRAKVAERDELQSLLLPYQRADKRAKATQANGQWTAPTEDSDD